MMIVTELKVVFQTLKPHIVAYRDYKYFNNKKFGPGIESFASEKNLKCKLLLKESMSLLMRFPPWQKIYIKLS